MLIITEIYGYNNARVKAYIDPNNFIITRKRKKYKFAKFHNAPNCFEFDEWKSQSVDCIEIGAGTGLFALELARRHPEWRVVAVDVKADRLQFGACQALEQGISNISFVRARADQVSEIVSPHTASAVWLTFSDPFPRKRSAGRRMTHATFLAWYREILHTDGLLYIKHDNPDFFAWSLEQLVANHWQIDELVFDLHESTLSDEYKILTSYETRWLDEGRVTSFVCASPITRQTDRHLS